MKRWVLGSCFARPRMTPRSERRSVYNRNSRFALPLRIASRSASLRSSPSTMRIVAAMETSPRPKGASVANRQRSGAEIVDAAPRAGGGAEEGGVGIEHPVVFGCRPGQPGLCSRKFGIVHVLDEFLEADADAAFEERHHRTHVMHDDLDRGQLLEQPREDKMRHCQARLVRPAEGKEGGEFGALQCRIVRERGGPDRMQPDRQIVLGHALENREESRFVERAGRSRW